MVQRFRKRCYPRSSVEHSSVTPNTVIPSTRYTTVTPVWLQTLYINNYTITVDGPNEGPSAPSVITSPSYRIEDSSAEGPLGPTVITSPSYRIEDSSTEGPLRPTLIPYLLFILQA